MQESRRTTEVIFENSDLLAVYKPKGLPTVPLRNKEGDSLLREIASDYPEVARVKAEKEWEGGIIHRLDTPTSGIVIAARNDETYQYLINAQKNNLIVKYYIARTSPRSELLPGFEPFPYTFRVSTLEIASYFRPYGERGASVRPVLNNHRYIKGIIYTTKANRTSEPNTFECIITRGFRHQIRCHLSWSGNPIIGDDRYGGAENEDLLLEAVKVELPYDGRILTIEV